METQSGQQADHPCRHALGGFDEGLVFVAFESRGDVKSSGDLPHMLADHEPAEIFARVAGGHEIAGAKDPEPIGCVRCPIQTGREIVTFTMHL